MVLLYAQWIREGKLPVNADWNTNNIKFTIQDPCNVVRKGFGNLWADEARFVLRSCVGEGNFIDTWPNKVNNYCCGGGGGYLQSGYKTARQTYGRRKHDQVMATGAQYVVTPCHNCHSQLHDLSEHYQGGYHAVHLWTIIALSLGILGPDERAYLGEDLCECGINECSLPKDA